MEELHRGALVSGYPTRDVAKLLGITSAQIRSFVRDGFVSPARGERGELLFSFQDVVLLRAARGLAQKLPARKVRRTLRRLKAQLPAGDSLTRLQIRVSGTDIVVRDGPRAWDPDTGQSVLDFESFETSEIAAKVAPLAVRRLAASDGKIKSAEEWYELALDLEAGGAHAAAERAYRAVVAIEPLHPDANINLGRILHASGDARGATSLYAAALEARPGDPTALFNLGVALEDLGDQGAALDAYTRALAADDLLADAHYNAARLYERRGEEAAAIRHLTRYRELVRNRG